MKNEIATAVVFITSIIKAKGKLTKEQLNTFSDKLTVALAIKYRNHWYESSPSRGQAYRCLRISSNAPEEPLLKRVAINSNLDYSQLCLPKDMVLWVDPGDVSCRFGDRGTTFLVSSFKKFVSTDNDTNNSVHESNIKHSNVNRYTKYNHLPTSAAYRNSYQKRSWSAYQSDDWGEQTQDRYHWRNIYNAQPLAVQVA